MLKRILNAQASFKNLPHDVSKITMRQSGSKYIIEAHCDSMPVIKIGSFATKEEAHSAMERLSQLTNRKIIK